MALLSDDVRARVLFHVSLLFRQVPSRHANVIVGSWISVTWQLLIDRPNPVFVKAHGGIHNDYIQHVADPASVLTPLGWELFASITVAFSLISLRGDSTRKRQYARRALRRISVLSESRRKALVRRGEADINDIVSLFFGEIPNFRSARRVPAWTEVA